MEWDWDLFYQYPKEVQSIVWRRDILASRTFWAKLSPVEGAGEVVRKLNFLSRGGVDVYYISNRMGINAKLQSELALYELGADYPTVLLTSSKVPIIKSLGLTFYIDDKLETLLEIMRISGKEKWNTTESHFFLLDAPYNREGRTSDLKVVSSIRDALVEAQLWR